MDIREKYSRFRTPERIGNGSRTVDALLGVAMAALLVSGCGGAARNTGALQGDNVRPVQLGRTAQPGAAQTSVLGPVNDAALQRAIENYRINKKRQRGPVQIAGADLNGDGVAEAVVLFSGKDWCTKTGCSLGIFQSDQYGYRVVSRTVRVKAPIVISPEQSNGWRDLLVSTGGAGSAPLRRIKLRFSGSGYARNAMLEDEIPPDVPQLGDVAIQAQ